MHRWHRLSRGLDCPDHDRRRRPFAEWCYNGDGPAYGSPIVADLAGERQVAGLTLNDFLPPDHVARLASGTIEVRKTSRQRARG